jgi:NAD(P)-dependent dehydrogenase (short-subunit alcohol dehydrogenase family)
MASLQGKTALVTGASQGIGRACALALAGAGAKVALAARNEAKLNEVAAEIAAAGGAAAVFALDIASEESIKSCAKSAIAHFGGIEILINNAGITRDTLVLRMKRAFSMGLSTAWVIRNVPVRLVPSTSSQSARFMRSTSVSRVMPALFMRISMPPK